MRALLSARARLRAWRAADREPFAALHAHPRVTHFLSGAHGRSDALAAQAQAWVAERGSGSVGG
jgi:RimJ/RimL family protein N-acetyltransferase